MSNISMVDLYNEDCIKVLEQLKKDWKKVDLIITDPPYIINFKSNRRTKLPKFNHLKGDTKKWSEDFKKTITKCFNLFFDTLKDKSAIYVFAGWQTIDFFKQEVEKAWFKIKNILIWVKNNHGSGDLKGAYAPKYEMVIYAVKWRHILNWKRHPDILEYKKISSKNLQHPTQKPIDLLRFLIEKSSKEWDLIMDTFMGSGSTWLACFNPKNDKMDRSFIWIELDKQYYDVANERMADKTF